MSRLATVAVEPLAMHVPEECFYIRFATFANYLWFRHLSREYGGDLGRMVTLRGSDAQVDQRIQQQMAVKETVLMDLFGDKIASEVALIGRDLFFREGSAFGTLLVARNNFALSAALNQQRSEALAAERSNGATLATVRIGDQDVSFLSTPDNRLRSFYAVDGDYHLVTTSRAMVERFFAAGRGEGAWGLRRSSAWRDDASPEPRRHGVRLFFVGLLSRPVEPRLSDRTGAPPAGGRPD